MDLIKFNDTAVITRTSGEVDDYDNLLETEVWHGNCRYQQGGQVYTGFLVRNSVLFIPDDIAVMENDKVIVTLSNGRCLGGVIGSITNVEMPLTYERTTRCELKQVMDINV